MPDPVIRRGLLLLRPNNIRVLGGQAGERSEEDGGDEGGGSEDDDGNDSYPFIDRKHKRSDKDTTSVYGSRAAPPAKQTAGPSSSGQQTTGLFNFKPVHLGSPSRPANSGVSTPSVSMASELQPLAAGGSKGSAWAKKKASVKSQHRSRNSFFGPSTASISTRPSSPRPDHASKRAHSKLDAAPPQSPQATKRVRTKVEAPSPQAPYATPQSPRGNLVAHSPDRAPAGAQYSRDPSAPCTTRVDTFGAPASSSSSTPFHPCASPGPSLPIGLSSQPYTYLADWPPLHGKAGMAGPKAGSKSLEGTCTVHGVVSGLRGFHKGPGSGNIIGLYVNIDDGSAECTGPSLFSLFEYPLPSSLHTYFFPFCARC